MPSRWILLCSVAIASGCTAEAAADQLESALRGSEAVLESATLTFLDELFPGPRGTAPEAYAW